MFDTAMVDVAIGLIFVYLVLALSCTAINELLAQLIAMRAKKLREALGKALTNGLDKDLYNHPLISHLARPGKWNALYGALPGKSKVSLPSYISSRAFSTALFDLVAPTNGETRSLDDLKNGVNALPNGPMKETLNALLSAGQANLEDVTKAVERWYDDLMDRVSGQYKRNIQIITLAIGLLLAVFMNVDSIALARRLSQDDALRAATVALATNTVNTMTPPTVAPEETVEATPGATPVATDDTGASDSGDAGAGAASDGEEAVDSAAASKQLATLLEETQALGLPLGWDDELRPNDAVGWLAKALGIALTAFAVSLGAPFWFDMLSKFVRVRSTGPVPPPTTETETTSSVSSDAPPSVTTSSTTTGASETS